MSRRCELTGKGPMSGNNVSHANNKTRRRFLPNLNDVSLQSEVLGRAIKFRISAAALRTVDHRGGLDAFFAKAKDDELSANALKVKKKSQKLWPPTPPEAFEVDEFGPACIRRRGRFVCGPRRFGAGSGPCMPWDGRLMLRP